MIFETVKFSDITVNHDKKRIPLSTMKRSKRQGSYRYYGAQGVIDYIDDYIFDGKYLLIAEDGENLKSKKQNIAQLAEGRFWVNNHAHIVQCNERCRLEYLCFMLNSMDLSGYITGSAQPKLSQANMNNISFEIPSVEMQDLILSVILPIEKRIATNTAINENLHQLIAAYYAEIFKECEHTAKISDYADRVFSGGTPTTSNESYWSGEFKWLSSGETSQKYIVDTEKTITQAGVDNSSIRLAKKYDTVIASAGQGHTRGQTSMLLTDTYINQSIIVVESERIYMPFIYWNICGRYEELRVISNSNSIRGSLTTKMISAFTSPKADITQISRFSELAWAAIHEIEKNCNEIARLAALRDTLLPKLMNGEIDVSAVQI